VEYKLELDIAAAQVVFNSSNVPLWQVPRDAYRLTLMSNSELFRRVTPCGRIGVLLTEAIVESIRWFEPHGWNLGETYIYGDSPLVLLTALQSSFYPETCTSAYRNLPAPGIRADGTTDFDVSGRPIRVYTSLDYRLMFEDFIAKLELHTAGLS
jgi:purine nucleosidase